MKWLKLLWSVVLLGFWALFLAYLSSRPSTDIINPAFGFIVITWVAICVITPIILVLRLFRVIRSPTSFIYILVGTASLIVGILGIFFVIPAGKVQNNIGTLIILVLNIILGCFIYTDAFVKTVPGLRREHESTE